MSADRATLAMSFGSVAQTYDDTRPDYPAAVLDHLDALLGAGGRPDGPRVADVGAGTGKLTRLLVARGWPVTAVEPDPGMRKVLVASLPVLRALDGRGEALPMGDGEVDLITYAQAWHWVDPQAGAAEAARALRAGGVLALIWNVYDDETSGDDWFAAVEELTRSGARSSQTREARSLPGLDALPVARFPWTETIDRARLRRRAQTWSSVSTLPAAERQQLLAELDDLLDTHPDTAGRDRLDIGHITVVHAYRRP